MAISDSSGPRKPSPHDGVFGDRSPATRGTRRLGGFGSVLFRQPESAESVEQPAFFRDLNFDAIVRAVLAGRQEYELEAFFALPLRRTDDVEYRHEVFRDLERDDVRAAVLSFAEEALRVRRQLVLAEKQHYRLEKQRWFLDAAALYARAVSCLFDALAGLELDSRGLLDFRAFLAGYTGSEGFRSLAVGAHDVSEGLERVRYTVRIKGTRVTVDAYEEGSDYSAEIEETFDRFRQGALEDRLATPRDTGSMDNVEAQIAQRVARLYPDEAAALERFCRDHRGFLDETVARFEREVQFYLAWLEHVERLEQRGLVFCHPVVSADSKEVSATAAFDLALAAKLAKDGSTVVRNDFHLRGPERILVVSGPNQGVGVADHLE
jgi:DNA mismatch repair protein MutS